MLGAIAGDVIGSVHEHARTKTKDFALFVPASTFTDDSVLGVATADALLGDRDFTAAYRRWARRYPRAGYGGRFIEWMRAPEPVPYGSFGNGSAMRVGPVAWAAADEADVLELARRTALPTHGHPDAVAGARATALAMWLARQGRDAGAIRNEIAARFGYDLSRSVGVLRASYGFDITAKGTVPAALVCALEADGFEDAVRNAVSLGGDADTLACIAGGLAEILFGVPRVIEREVLSRLDPLLADVVARFRKRFGA